MPRLTPEQRLAKAKEDLARAQAAIKDRDRKNDTRRKIILGAALIERAKTDAPVAGFVRNSIAKLDRASDKLAFEGWDPKFAVKPATVPEQAPSPAPPLQEKEVGIPRKGMFAKD